MSDRDLEGWTIAFDLDGTLVDSAPDLIGTLNRMLVEEGLPAVPMESASTLIGSGARALLVHGFEAAGDFVLHAAKETANTVPDLNRVAMIIGDCAAAAENAVGRSAK